MKDLYELYKEKPVLFKRMQAKFEKKENDLYLEYLFWKKNNHNIKAFLDIEEYIKEHHKKLTVEQMKENLKCKSHMIMSIISEIDNIIKDITKKIKNERN